MATPIASMDDAIYQITQGNYGEYDFNKISAIAGAIGVFHSFWLDVGYPGAAISPPASGVVYDGSPSTISFQNGALSFPSVSPSLRYLTGIEGQMLGPHLLFLADRLVGVGSVTISSAGAKTINTPGLPLRALTVTPGVSGIGAEVWLEFTTATTTTALSAIITYTNQNGIASQTSWPLVAANAVMNIGSLMGPFQLAPGDNGVQSVQKLTVLGTAPAVGVVNVIVINRLADLPIATNVWNNRDMFFQIPSLPPIYDNACLMLGYLSGNAVVTTLTGKLKTVYK